MGRPTAIQWLADGGEAGLRISILSQLIFLAIPPMSPKHDIVGYINPEFYFMIRSP